MPIKVEIHGISQVDKLADLFNRSRAILMEKMMEASKKFAFDAQARTKKDYLSGPRPSRLGAPSGRLRSSITSDIRRTGEIIEITNGTNIQYAPIHEFGFSGTVDVDAHRRIVTKVFGRSVGAVIQSVGAHKRNMKMPKRPFLGPGMEDARPAFEERIQKILGNVPFGEASGE